MGAERQTPGCGARLRFAAELVGKAVRCPRCPTEDDGLAIPVPQHAELAHRLRAKIDESFEPKLLHTVRGVGYALKTP